MRRTAQLIEEHGAAKQDTQPPQSRRTPSGKKLRNGKDPSIGKNTQFKPGVSGNPGGKPKHDVAAALARAIIEGNQEAIYNGFAKVLKNGGAYAFSVLADRAYGKTKETIEHTGADGTPLSITVKLVKPSPSD